MKNKFNAKKVILENIKFDSKKEAFFYHQLKLQMKASNKELRVIDIELQPRFDIVINNKKIGFYKADFRVKYGNGETKIYDVKGCKHGCSYQLFRLKKKIVEAIYNIEIIEI